MASQEIPYRGPETIVDTPELRDLFHKRFPYVEYSPKALELTKAMIGIAALVEKLKTIERIPQGADGRRENLAEHSYMVALAAIEMARILELDIDIGTALGLGLNHDNTELITGDTNTFSQTEEERAEKEKREAVATAILDSELPPSLAAYTGTYEKGGSPEAAYIRAIDKLAPQAVNYAGHMRIIFDDLGVHDYDPEVLSEFHNRRNFDYYNRFGGDFPAVVAAHGLQSIFLEQKVARDRDALRSAKRERAPNETERKFLIDLESLSETLDLTNPEIKKELIKQFYVKPKEGESESRVRSIDDKVFQQTVKYPGTIQRKEDTTNLDHMTPRVFDVAFEEAGVGNVIVKTRYSVPLGNGLVAEVDIFHGALEGLATVEVEFNGRDALMKANDWTPPVWFGKELTSDGRFRNKNLTKINKIAELFTEEEA